MNGINYILDTNCIIELLQNNNEELLHKLENANWIGVSIISKIEFLAFPGIQELDRKLFLDFLKLVDVIDIRNKDEQLLELITIVRSENNLKLPDSIIMATAKSNNAILLTRDKKLLNIKSDSVEPF